MKTSDSIGKIAPAFLKSQKEIGAAVKGSTNPFFHSKYADLGSVMEACKDKLNSNGIMILQPVMGEVVETTLLHESGEWITSETKIVSKSAGDPQAQGSAITYARRYGLQSLVFIPAEDDDAEGAMARQPISNQSFQTTDSAVSKNFLTKINLLDPTKSTHSEMDAMVESIRVSSLTGQEKYNLIQEVDKKRKLLPTVKV